jgi:hypothetical protein
MNMAEAIDQPDEGNSGTSAQAPSTPGIDLDELVKRVAAAITPVVDTRISGFQSVVDKKFDGVSRALNTMRRQSLDPEEAAAQDKDERDAELEALRQTNAMLLARREHPEAVDFLMDLYGEKNQSFESQIAYIESKLGKQAAAQVVDAVVAAAEAAGAGSGETPPTSPSASVQTPAAATSGTPVQPPRATKTGPETAIAMARTKQMTEDAADAILASAGPGALLGD